MIFIDIYPRIKFPDDDYIDTESSFEDLENNDIEESSHQFTQTRKILNPISDICT